MRPANPAAVSARFRAVCARALAKVDADLAGVELIGALNDDGTPRRRVGRPKKLRWGRDQ